MWRFIGGIMVGLWIGKYMSEQIPKLEETAEAIRRQAEERKRVFEEAESYGF